MIWTQKSWTSITNATWHVELTSSSTNRIWKAWPELCLLEPTPSTWRAASNSLLWHLQPKRVLSPSFLTLLGYLSPQVWTPWRRTGTKSLPSTTTKSLRKFIAHSPNRPNLLSKQSRAGLSPELIHTNSQKEILFYRTWKRTSLSRQKLWKHSCKEIREMVDHTRDYSSNGNQGPKISVSFLMSTCNWSKFTKRINLSSVIPNKLPKKQNWEKFITMLGNRLKRMFATDKAKWTRWRLVSKK